jgi:hypothetical protein
MHWMRLADIYAMVCFGVLLLGDDERVKARNIFYLFTLLLPYPTYLDHLYYYVSFFYET